MRFPMRLVLYLFLLICQAAWAQKKTIFLITDAEGVGGVDVIAAMAGHFGTPVIMLSGDQAAANELHEIVPEAELAVVKEGLGRYTCISLSAASAREVIREAARRGVSKIGSIKPYTIS